MNGVSEEIFKIGMCLPAGPYVNDDDVRYIVETIKNAIAKSHLAILLISLLAAKETKGLL